MIRVLIADDHGLVRDGLKKILSETDDITVVDEASTGQEVLEKVRAKDVDVILLDISMPGKNGLDALAELKKERPKCQVLILSMHPEEQYALRALKSGASGYLTKRSAATELIDALHRVSAGKRYITSSIAESLAAALSYKGGRAAHETLSNREFQVLRMMAAGKSIKEIAAELFLSVKTVSTYRSRVLEKMEMKNTSQLMYYAIKNDLID